MTVGEQNTTARAKEARRRYCLQAMGVELYFSKRDLPAAKVSVLPEPLALDGYFKAQGTITSGADQGEINTPTSPAQAVAIELKPKQRKANNSIENTVQVPAGLRFQLRIWRVATDLLIVDSRDAEVALPTDALLRNMMAALGYKPEQIAKPEILRWPFVNRKTLPQTDNQQENEDARAMVRAYIEAQQQTHQLQLILLMGEAALRFATPASAQIESYRWQNLSVLENCRGIGLPSLAELLRDPALKKNTWQAIRHLRLDGQG
jgi:hypothetical protein